MRLLGIFHYPQECGEPFIQFVNLENGEVVREKTITFPDMEGYYDSGVKSGWKYYSTNIVKGVETYSSNHLPKLGEIKDISKNNTCISTKIEVLEECTFNNGGKFYTYKITWCKCIRKYEKRFNASDDTFRQELEKQGVNMKGWSVYKRRKTDFNAFLKQIFPDAINIIRIG